MKRKQQRNPTDSSSAGAKSGKSRRPQKKKQRHSRLRESDKIPSPFSSSQHGNLYLELDPSNSVVAINNMEDTIKVTLSLKERTFELLKNNVMLRVDPTNGAGMAWIATVGDRFNMEYDIIKKKYRAFTPDELKHQDEQVIRTDMIIKEFKDVYGPDGLLPDKRHNIEVAVTKSDYDTFKRKADKMKCSVDLLMSVCADAAAIVMDKYGKLLESGDDVIKDWIYVKVLHPVYADRNRPRDFL